MFATIAKYNAHGLVVQLAIREPCKKSISRGSSDCPFFRHPASLHNIWKLQISPGYFHLSSPTFTNNSTNYERHVLCNRWPYFHLLSLLT